MDEFKEKKGHTAAVSVPEIDFDSLTPRGKSRINVFLGEIFYLNEEQNRALDGLVPMTQEIFDSIMDCLEEKAAADEMWMEIFLKYPEFALAHAEKLEAEIGLSDEGGEDFRPKDMEAEKAWERFRVRMKEKKNIII